MAYTKGFRFNKVPGLDNKHALTRKQNIEPEYSAEIDITPDADTEETFVRISLEGNATLTAGVTRPFVSDKMRIFISTDSTERTVTFSDGFIAGELPIGSDSQAIVDFMFSDYNEKWIEVNRKTFV
jgi:hypothetical protein